MPRCYDPVVTWVKAELTDEQNDMVEQYQEQNDLSKPEAVAELVHKGAIADKVDERIIRQLDAIGEFDQ